MIDRFQIPVVRANPGASYKTYYWGSIVASNDGLQTRDPDGNTSPVNCGLVEKTRGYTGFLC